MKTILWTVLLLSVVFAAIAYVPEETILTDYGDMVFRPDSSTLCIITEGGDSVLFENNRDWDNAEEFAVYKVIDYLPKQGYWVIEMGGYEWMEWRLVNGNTGNTQTIISEPIPSPDGNRLLCFKEDLRAGFIPNGIQVWRIDPDAMTLEFEDVDVPWGPIDAEWVGDSSVVFNKMSYDCETWETLTLPGRLELGSDGIWIPDDPADWIFTQDEPVNLD